MVYCWYMLNLRMGPIMSDTPANLADTSGRVLTHNETVDAVHDLLQAIRLLRSLTFDCQVILNEPLSAAFDKRVAQGVLDALDLIDGRKLA